MGSIYQQKRLDPKTGERVEAGPYWIKYYRNGRPFRESTHSEKLTEARHLLQLREGQIREGRLPALRAQKTTIAQLAALYVNDYEANHRKSLKEAKYYAALLTEFFGEMRAANLSSEQLTAYRLRRQAAGVKDSTVNRELSALRRMYHLGTEQTPPLVAAIPRIELVAEHNVRRGFFELEEFQAVRGALPDHAKVPAIIAYYTGMRSGEVFSLRWAQVELTRGLIRLEPGTTKNDEGRTIGLSGELREALERWRLETLAAYPGCPWVCHYEGQRLGSIKTAWATACQRVGLGGKLFHDLRRSGVRNLVRAGVPQAVAKAISGHKTDSVFNRYNIVSERDMIEAAGKLDRYLDAHQVRDGHHLGIMVGETLS